MMRILLTAAAAFAATVVAQTYDPRKDFCRRFSHEGTVLGNRLYINDGQLNLLNHGGKNFTNDRLLFHDLSTTMLDGVDTQFPPLETNLSKPAIVPSLIGGALWADQANGRLFQYGGQWPDNKVPEDRFQLWTYDVYSDTWDTRDANRAVDRLSFGANTAIEYTGKAYQLGGWMNVASDINWVGPRKASNRMAVYDMVTNSWTNSSGPMDGVGRAEGAMFYVPFGDDPGMLVHFGGVKSKDGGPEVAAPMDVIDIYDIANQNWYTQNATGDIPNTRRRFCGGAAYAQDGSSANIYIYGGMGFGANVTGYDDVYILSIPSFTWIQIFPAKGTTREESEIRPHYDLSCSVVKNSQLVIIGGQFPKDLEAKTCDAENKFGVHNLVMSKVNKGTQSVYWDIFVPSRATYTVPDDITNVIGGDGNGNAATKSPKAGFNANDLSVLFARTVTTKARTPTRAAPTPTSSAANNTGNNTGAFSTPAKRARILAPALGGAALLAALAGFLLYRRKRTRTKEKDRLPGYESATAAAESVVTTHTPYSPLPPQHGMWSPPPPPPPPPPPEEYGYLASAYSENSFASSLTARQMSPPPPPPLAELGGWVSPAPGSMVARGSTTGVVQGHYPPPLQEGMAEVRASQPEMKELKRDDR
ncbi:hypothetical protein FN846DRAFT_231777 [Sphaerosporella brunnea]|uniref:Kelch repeat protein n=1 Tax=Sphaerosporella brunnea TaxID=1250544 RepID=A0A5J5EPN4_9PEZI|nr:hypothetical protein FN846DRAFT_231777 [Sphaerosporella brunnea]